MSVLASLPPDAEAFLACAERCFATLPAFMREAAGDVRIVIMDFAEDDILDAMGIADPLDLTGLYTGIPLTLESVTNPALERPLIFLYRLPILFEWASRGDTTIEALITHVFIHELGHHFGWSDEEMDATLLAAERGQD